MRYSNMTLSYIRHNFLKSMGIMFLPALLIGILLNPLSIAEIIVSIGKKQGAYNSFLDIYGKINGYTGVGRFVAIIITLVIAIIFLSLLSGSIRQKMRYGLDNRGKWSMLGSHLNDNFLPVLKYLLLLFVSLEVLAILLSTFLYTTIKLFKNALPMCLILAFIFILVELLILSASLLTVPNMTMKGYGLFKAFGHSVYSLSARTFKVFGSILWIIILMSVPMIALILFPFKGANYLMALFSFLFYWIIASYIGVLVYVVYFDVEELEREDLKL
ncbi:MAG: hypothetical protein K2I46_05395 [Clostridia bacterium]|nr:hypothetical protein [Clostridia bacterium]MDE6472672.1 hypothetical protein [Clostridia bacterium]